MDDRKTLEIRYAFWRLLRYLALSAGGLALSWYVIQNGHWSLAALGWIGLPLAGISLADALWRVYGSLRGPDLVLSLDGMSTYGTHIPWSAVYYITAKREFGMSNIELHFFPGAGDHFKFDLAGRLARWASKSGGNDGLLLSAFALQIGHDELAALIEAYRAEAHRELSGGAGPTPLDAPA